MKKIYRYFFAAIAIASAAACAEQIENDQVPGGQTGPADFAQMTISASLDEVTKTTYKDQSVLWEGTESITVFSRGSEDSPAQFEMTDCSGDKTSATFTGLANLNAESYYAVYPHSATNACTAEGVLTVNIPSAQTAVAGGFASGANVSVAAWQKSDFESEGNIIFNNVCTLLSFGFETDADAVLTKSVTVKVKKNATEYFGIAGNVSVSYNPEGDLVVSEGTTDNIVLTAPTGGFAKGVTYYVLVAPVGQIAEMELTYTHTDGTTTCTRKNSNIIASLSRSTLVPLETIPVAYDNLPQEDFEVPIDFTGAWPFEERFVEADSQESTGETYTYKYSSAEATVNLAFDVQKGQNYTKSVDDDGDGVKEKVTVTHSYSHSQGALSFEYVSSSGVPHAGGGTTYGLIRVPGIEGRWIDKVEIVYNGVKYFTFADGLEFKYGASPNANQPDADQGKNPAIFELPYGSKGQVTAIMGRAYIVRLRGAGTKISSIKIIYSKNLPTK